MRMEARMGNDTNPMRALVSRIAQTVDDEK